MPDIQEPVLDLDPEEEIPSQTSASIQVPSQPRHALQKILQPIPGKKPSSTSSKTPAIDISTQTQSAAIAEKPEIPVTSTKEKNLLSPPIQVTLETECQKLTLVKLFKKTLAFINEEWEELRNDPLDYIQNGFHNILANSKQLGAMLIKSLIDLTSSVCSSVKEFVNSLFEAANSNKQLTNIEPPNQSSISSGAWSWLTKSSSPTLNSASSNSSSTTSSPVNSPIDEDLISIGVKKKGALELLLEGVQQVVAALLEKKEEQRKSEFEEAVEHKERLEKEAKERLRQAESLRPDLADELDLPSTDFIFASAFDEIPNVDELIRQAEERRESKKTH